MDEGIEETVIGELVLEESFLRSAIRIVFKPDRIRAGEQMFGEIITMESVSPAIDDCMEIMGDDTGNRNAHSSDGISLGEYLHLPSRAGKKLDESLLGPQRSGYGVIVYISPVGYDGARDITSDDSVVPDEQFDSAYSPVIRIESKENAFSSRFPPTKPLLPVSVRIRSNAPWNT